MDYFEDWSWADRFQLFTRYYCKHDLHSIRLMKGSCKSTNEGLLTPFSEITRGRITSDNNETFVPLFRDYWSDHTYLSHDLPLDDMRWVWNRLKELGYVEKMEQEVRSFKL